jgi:hypothetical protein
VEVVNGIWPIPTEGCDQLYPTDLQLSDNFGCSPKDSFTGGDPHFKTWHNQWYDFHGICDLVLLENDEFDDGKGMDIVIRTKPRYEYSFIEAAAIKLGEDILEVGSYGSTCSMVWRALPCPPPWPTSLL